MENVKKHVFEAHIHKVVSIRDLRPTTLLLGATLETYAVLEKRQKTQDPRTFDFGWEQRPENLNRTFHGAGVKVQF